MASLDVINKGLGGISAMISVLDFFSETRNGGSMRQSAPVKYGQHQPYYYEASRTIHADETGRVSSRGKSDNTNPSIGSSSIRLHVMMEQAPLKTVKSAPLEPLKLPKAPSYTRREKSIAGLQGVAAQWNVLPESSDDDDLSVSCRLESYDFLTFEEIISNATSNQPSQPNGSSVEGFHCGHFIRHVKLIQREKGNMDVYILCEGFKACIGLDGIILRSYHRIWSKYVRTSGNQTASLSNATERFKAELVRLYRVYHRIQKPNNIRQVFMLQVYHAHLNTYAAFLEEFEASYTRPRMRIFDPQYSRLRSWTIKAINTDSAIYRQLSSSATNITSTCESLLDIVGAMDKPTDGEPNTELLCIFADVRSCCQEVTERLTGMSDELQHYLNLLSLSWNVNQSNNVKILTLLATIFLPLSLSAGILSMGTRFKDLGYLIYDFFGVVTLLGALVVAVILILFLVAFLQEFESRQQYWSSFKLWPAVLIVGAFIFLTLGALLLSSFVVGIFKDVGLGAKILGYGLAVAFGLPIFLVILTALGVWTYRAIQKGSRAISRKMNNF
ncbi:hypothetical protein EsH8_X_000035 [Colletotrichum jinshuiense]